MGSIGRIRQIPRSITYLHVFFSPNLFYSRFLKFAVRWQPFRLACQWLLFVEHVRLALHTQKPKLRSFCDKKY